MKMKAVGSVGDHLKHSLPGQADFRAPGIGSEKRYEGESDVFCYECHEVLLLNPLLLPEDVAR
jgi:hypothetical protein